MSRPTPPLRRYILAGGVIPIEAARLCGIRQEPLESWIKDADGRNVPELALNTWLMAEAFLQLLATGLGALILVSGTTVVLGVFSTIIRKEDFWYITAISIIQSAKVVGSISGPTARFLVQFPAASMHRVILTWRRRAHVGDVTVFVGRASIVPTLFASAPIVTAIVCYALSGFGLIGVVHNYRGSADTYTRRGNMKPALIAFYSLVLVQVTLFSLWCSASWVRSAYALRFSHEYFGIGNTNGEELVDRYTTQTHDKCIEKGVFSTTNWTLVSFAAELLQSEHRSDHVSAVSVLRVLTTRKERAAGAVEQICSSEQVVGSLFKLLRPKSPLDLETKAYTAEILTKLAGKLSLTHISGAAHSISSLLDLHPRFMKTAARDKPLIVHGLKILGKLASDPVNCTEICKTMDLVPKILAPLTHGLLNTIGNEAILISDENVHKTTQIVKASLRVVAKLTRGMGESSTKLRDEKIPENGKTAENIMWVMRNSSSEEEMRILAMKILARLTLEESTMHDFIAYLKDLLFEHHERPLRVSAGKALNV